MRKYILFILILLLTLGTVYSQSSRPIAAVKNTSGIVKLQKSGTGKIGTADVGTLLYNGDRLTTEKFAMVAILFIDGSMLKVKELSDVTLNAVTSGEGELDTKIDLPLGEIWSKVTRRESNFDIHTPSSVASVKGTEFAVGVDMSGSTALFVFQGKVELRNDLGSVLVKKNRKSTAKVDEAPLKPSKMTPSERESDSSFNIPRDSKWNLKINLPEGRQASGRPFKVEVTALESVSKSVDARCSADIAVSSATALTVFSLDNKNWSEEINTSMNKGKLQVYVKCGREGDMVFSVSGSQCESAKADIAIYKTEEQKNREESKILQMLKDAGIEGLDDLRFTGSKLQKECNLETILDRVLSGELKIDTFEIDEDEEGGKKIIVQIKPTE